VHQLSTIALPRRFSLPMQEIWLMQSRFPQRQRKRVMRTLAHPRFRAAWDFLLLRGAASGEAHSEDIEFWREAQDDPDRAIAEHPALEGEGDAEGAPRRKRRRRR